jgi:predicted nucleic acid-binding protein
LKLTFDTNILVYAADRDAGHRHDVATQLIRRAARADCIMVLQTLGEFIRAATRRVGLDLEAAAGFVEDWQTVFTIVEAVQVDLRAAIDAVQNHRLSFWDAMLWATAKRAGCRYLLSEDFQNGRALGGVTFLNPFDPANGTALAGILPPA